MKIGLIGGSFNPAHQGHLYIALAAKKRFKLQQIWFLPTKQNPLKTPNNIDFNQRFAQILNLTKNHPGFLVKDYELKLASNYTIDLLKKITKQYRQHQFCWIMGADNLPEFHLWHRWRAIIKLMPMIIFDRNNYSYSSIKSRAFLFCCKIGNSNKGKKCHFLRIKKNPLSSTILNS